MSDIAMIGIIEIMEVVAMTSCIIIENTTIAKGHDHEVMIDIGSESVDIEKNLEMSIHAAMMIMSNRVLPKRGAWNDN